MFDNFEQYGLVMPPATVYDNDGSNDNDNIDNAINNYDNDDYDYD